MLACLKSGTSVERSKKIQTVPFVEAIRILAFFRHFCDARLVYGIMIEVIVFVTLRRNFIGQIGHKWSQVVTQGSHIRKGTVANHKADKTMMRDDDENAKNVDYRSVTGLLVPG
jgi:hypothetical protein